MLLPATRAAGAAGRRYLEHNDPDRAAGPFHKFLEEARKEIGGILGNGRADIVRLG